MSYQIKEIYYTLQGEGHHTGRPAVFIRFAGCNLWSGREEDRAAAICNFCDTDFVGTDGPGGGTYASPAAVADRVWETSPETLQKPYVVCTGGEPLLQLDAALIAALHARDCVVAVETNGTCPTPANLDWICMSPKPHTELRLTRGDELKFIYPQPELTPEDVAHLDFDHFYLQPMDNHRTDENTRLAVEYCLSHPRWKLSLQTHKLLNLP